MHLPLPQVKIPYQHLKLRRRGTARRKRRRRKRRKRGGRGGRGGRHRKNGAKP
jgi:hypothetical protein